MLDTQDIDFYRKNGWLKIKGFFDRAFLESFWVEFNYLLGKKAKQKFPCTDKCVNEKALIHLFENDRESLSGVYRSLRHLPSLQKMLVSHEVEQIYRKLCPEVTQINLCPYTGTRIDFKGEEQYLFDWHQDYHYIQLSPDSLVYWFPLSELDETGAIEILEGSHKDGLLNAKMIDPTNSKRNGAKTLSIAHNVIPKKYKSITPKADIGDLIVFNTLTLHKSIPQKENRYRVTCQYRLGNFGNEDAVERSWPVGLLEGRHFALDHPEFIDE